MSNIFSRTIRKLSGGRNGKPAQCASRSEYRARLEMTLSDWLLYHQQDVIFQDCTWMGVRTLKNPLDAWIYQEILFEVKPDVVLEIGSYEGGGTLFFANILDLIGAGTVVSVDIDRSRYNVSHERIRVVTGDSSSPEVVSQVRSICEGKRVLVIHDGGHTMEQVTRDMNAYAGLVCVGSYFIVEDGVVDLFEAGDGLGLDSPGPLAAVEEFVKVHPEFESDSARERYVLTYNPRGFLKRVR